MRRSRHQCPRLSEGGAWGTDLDSTCCVRRVTRFRYPVSSPDGTIMGFEASRARSRERHGAWLSGLVIRPRAGPELPCPFGPPATAGSRLCFRGYSVAKVAAPGFGWHAIRSEGMPMPPAPGISITRDTRDPDAVRRILEDLPDWFGIEEAVREYVETAGRLTNYLAVLEGQVVGVLLLEQHFPPSAEIHLIAVDPRLHRKGVGSLPRKPGRTGSQSHGHPIPPGEDARRLASQHPLRQDPPVPSDMRLQPARRAGQPLARQPLPDHGGGPLSQIHRLTG